MWQAWNVHLARAGIRARRDTPVAGRAFLRVICMYLSANLHKEKDIQASKGTSCCAWHAACMDVIELLAVPVLCRIKTVHVIFAALVYRL